MKLKWFINTTAIALLIMVALLGLAKHDSVMAAQDEGSKIEGLLLDRFSADGNADFIVRFTEQADLSAAYAMDWNSRGEFVYNSLLDTATRSQANAKSILDVQGLTYQTYIAGNDLHVAGGTLELANQLASLPEVYFIRATRTYYIDPVTVVKPLENITWAGDYLMNNTLTTVGNSINATTDWGIIDSKADQFWAAFTVQGDGIKVANIDTGVQWNHPALVNQFACPGDPGNVDCWEDPSNICAGGLACDNNGHGTHTMGTMVADDDPNLTYIAGMAPNATWIACKGCESSSCSDTALNACADWILAPGGDPVNRPNVVNNSWGGGGGDNWYQAKVQAWVAAGIFPAFSAGNNTGCGSMGSPGDYQESFASTGHTSSRAHAWSQGPSPFGHEPYTKPNITAPSNNICSTVPTNGWNCGYSGTSMASPHSAGAVALLWSCNPDLIGNVDMTFQALQDSADAPDPSNPACGVPPDNEGTYEDGYGYLNVLQAGTDYCGNVDFGTLEGYVYDQDMNPVEGATVTAQSAPLGNSINATTDPNGFYSMDLVVGTYDVTASKTNYTSQTVTGVVVAMGVTTVQDFQISYLGSWTQIALPTSCPDWYRYDGEFFAGTGLAYFMGGRPGADTNGSIYSFDPSAQTCADTGLDMPVPISNYTIVPLNVGGVDWLCTFGGRNSAGAMILTTQCYDPLSNTTTTLADLPSIWNTYLPGGAAVVNNKAYIFGGFSSTTAPYNHAYTYEYDPATNSYIQKGNLTLGRAYIDVAVYDGKIYGFGGDTYDGASLIASAKTEVFDPVAGMWDDAAVAELPTASGEGRAFSFEADSGYQLAGKIVLAGGGQWADAWNEVEIYDVASNTYDYTFPDLTSLRRDFAGFFVPGDPGVMWVIGGWSGADTPPFGQPEYYEVPLTAEPEPDIVVDPLALSATLLPDATTTMTLTIANQGTLDLNWVLAEEPGVKILGVSTPSVPVVVQGAANPVFTGTPAVSHQSVVGTVAPYNGSLAVLFDQTDNPSGGSFSSQDFEPFYDSYDNQGADDFTVPSGVGGWSIQSLYVPGSNSGIAVPAVNVYLYIDNAGLPGAEVYVASGVVPVDDGLGNLTITLPTPAILPAGDYWVSFQAAMDIGTYGQWFWGSRTLQTANPWAWQNPGDGFGLGCTTWAYGFSVCGVGSDPDALFRLEGTVLADVPWLSETPTAGTVAPGASQDVVVTFDSTVLAIGEYLASLDITSNDPATPVVNVPVTLTVVENAHVAVAHLAPFSMDPGTAVTITLNGTPALTDFAFADSTIYLDLFPGEYLVEVWPMGAVEPAITATVDLVGGMDYSVVAVGDGDNQPLELIALVDDNTPPVTGKFHLRLGHLAPFAATGTEADICLQDGTAILTNVPYGAVASYLPLDAGTYDLVIAAAGTDCGVVLIDPLPVTFIAGQIVTAFAVGNGTLQELGVFAWPSDAVGFLLPLKEGFTIFLPVVLKDTGG